MGKVLQYTPLGFAANTVAGKGPLAKALGMDGKQQDYYQGSYKAPQLEDAPQFQSPALEEMGVRNAVQGNQAVNEALAGYGQGQGSLQDALGKVNHNLQSQGQLSEFYNKAATDPMSGSRLATDQVQGNAILGQLFGKGGALERANSEEQELASRGYELKKEDHEAYGQASGNIARLFGQQEQGLAQSLADRGLGASPSGVAGAGFSGLQGNKMEQLAQAQTSIADKRMQNNLQRLNATRTYMAELGNQGASAIQDQYGRQLAGVQEQRTGRENLVGNQLDLFKQQSANTQAMNNARIGVASQGSDDAYRSAMNKQGREGQTILGALGRGIYKGAEAAPGIGMNAAMGTK